MLRLTLTPGDYFTVNGNIVVQLHRLEGERSLIAVEAPKEMRIVRGAVLEREGGQRPLCLTDRPAPSRRGKWFLWDQGREDAARHMRRLLREIETPENRRQIETLCAQLTRISQQDAPDGQEGFAHIANLRDWFHPVPDRLKYTAPETPGIVATVPPEDGAKPTCASAKDCRFTLNKFLRRKTTCVFSTILWR